MRGSLVAVNAHVKGAMTAVAWHVANLLYMLAADNNYYCHANVPQSVG